MAAARQHPRDRRDPVRQLHVGAGTMRDPRAARGKQVDLRLGDPDHVGKHGILVQNTQPIQLLRLSAPRPRAHRLRLGLALGKVRVEDQPALARKVLHRAH